MDFDGSKENILPLRGGRNVSQLGTALQAQNDVTQQKKLQETRELFEALIRTYTGNDPLENWFNYIAWVEQSYPKQGHEGNVLPLLEDCLNIFEFDPRYKEDPRLCKLFIKYIDLKPNPLELYHMLYAKGICRSCADMYKAWAYYYEASDDFQSAHRIIEMGKRELAQPFHELEAAQKHLVVAAGRHMIYGRNPNELIEKRQALTSLRNFKLGGSANNHNMPGTSTSNAAVSVYEDKGEELAGVEIAPKSIIAAAKRQEVPKENTLRPGPWTTVPVKKKQAVARSTPGFLVHVDGDDDNRGNVSLSKLVPETKENYSNWIVSLTIPEPKDERMIPMYPKDKVYCEINTEYSIEELRAMRYIKNKEKSQSFKDSSVNVFLNKEVSLMKSFHDLSNTRHEASFNQISNNVPNTESPVFQNQRSFTLWSSPATDSPAPCATKARVSKFPIYEQSNFEERVERKGDAMKTPLKDLNAEELAETGSRGGMDVAAAAPVDSAKRLPIFEDDNSSPFGVVPDPSDFGDLSCNTQMFNFNLNAMQVSTPQNKQDQGVRHSEEVGKIAAKQLFTESLLKSDDKGDKKNGLSTIIEESKNFGQSSSSGSSGVTTKSSISGSHVKQRTMATISEEHNSYLAQNLLANAALRTSLLGEFMDLGQQPTPVAVNQTSQIANQASFSHHSYIDAPIPSPTVTTRLNFVPSDPFKHSLIESLLRRVNFPGVHTNGYCYLPNVSKPTMRKEAMSIGHDAYLIEKQLGKGTYGTVFRGTNDATGITVAIKYQKPANKWEFYICRELQSRLAHHPLRERFMNITVGYFSDQASVLISEFVPSGSLLDVANVVKQRSGRSLKESLCIHFCLEMLKIVQAMHEVQIIHADIKPDNFLVKLFPNDIIGLQLIDFGCSIDMSLFPEGASFTRKVTTEDFVCCEMLDNRPWNYHTDLFCVAATAHVLLFEKYIQLQKRGENWSISNRLPRYASVDLWNMFFSTLLNQQNGPADSATLQSLLEDSLNTKFENYQNDLRYLTNILKNR